MTERSGEASGAETGLWLWRWRAARGVACRDESAISMLTDCVAGVEMGGVGADGVEEAGRNGAACTSTDICRESIIEVKTISSSAATGQRSEYSGEWSDTPGAWLLVDSVPFERCVGLPRRSSCFMIVAAELGTAET